MPNHRTLATVVVHDLRYGFWIPLVGVAVSLLTHNWWQDPVKSLVPSPGLVFLGLSTGVALWAGVRLVQESSLQSFLLARPVSRLQLVLIQGAVSLLFVWLATLPPLVLFAWLQQGSWIPSLYVVACLWGGLVCGALGSVVLEEPSSAFSLGFVTFSLLLLLSTLMTSVFSASYGQAIHQWLLGHGESFLPWLTSSWTGVTPVGTKLRPFHSLAFTAPLLGLNLILSAMLGLYLLRSAPLRTKRAKRSAFWSLALLAGGVLAGLVTKLQVLLFTT